MENTYFFDILMKNSDGSFKKLMNNLTILGVIYVNSTLEPKMSKVLFLPEPNFEIFHHIKPLFLASIKTLYFQIRVNTKALRSITTGE